MLKLSISSAMLFEVAYLMTPDNQVAVDWKVFKQVLNRLSEAEKRVAQRVKLRLDLIDRAEFEGNLSNSAKSSADGQRLVKSLDL